ncbi:MAG: hypothetical protein ACJAXA_003366 [Candidatus Aldehydirespiratoraceae bacterium]|jgi:hypothetical protein
MAPDDFTTDEVSSSADEWTEGESFVAIQWATHT